LPVVMRGVGPVFGSAITVAMNYCLDACVLVGSLYLLAALAGLV